ncbi:MAG: hypothetical protein V1754_04755 [Pseudomonadota bacterium]
MSLSLVFVACNDGAPRRTFDGPATYYDSQTPSYDTYSPTICGPTNCPGCCQGSNCITQMSALACGASGLACVACASGESCVDGKCASTTTQCGPTNCAMGCCDGTQCVTVLSTQKCGTGGQTCAACNADQTCVAGVCATSTPNCATACTGCCQGQQCVPLAQVNNNACGVNGGNCIACTSPETCQSGVCKSSNPSSGLNVGSVIVSGSTCQDSWQNTGNQVVGTNCIANIQLAQIGVGKGAEPNKYGCKVAPGAVTVNSYLHERDCDDDTVISLECNWACGDQTVEVGSVLVDGASTCDDKWQNGPKNIGVGKNCEAFVGYVRLGVGYGAEPNKYGCRYNAGTGQIEVYLHEVGCEDKKNIDLECNYLCWQGSGATTGTAKLSGDWGQCYPGWQQTSTNIGSGKKCIAGIEYMRLGVGVGVEPNMYGCRYNASSGYIEAYLDEVDCDDKGIEIVCRYLCL